LGRKFAAFIFMVEEKVVLITVKEDQDWDW
jgi:hypothetical protein